MHKNYLKLKRFALVLLLMSQIVVAQVGIGTASPANGTLLHIDDGAGNKGVLMPKVTIDNLNSVAPLTGTVEVGTLVFNAAGTNPFGFYYWDSTKWVQLIGSDTDESIYTNNGTLTAERTVSMQNYSLSFANSQGRTIKLIPAATDINSPFTFQTDNSYNFVTDTKNALTINHDGLVGVDKIDPVKSLHIGGTSSTIRVDGLNTTNNANNIAADPVPIYVNNDGDLVTQPSLIQSFMPLNLTDFLGVGATFGSASGDGLTALINESTITLTQRSLVHYTYQYSVSISKENGSAITDGAPRLFRSWFTVNTDTANRHGFDTGTYTNSPESTTGNKTYASGFYYLSGSGYVELPAGTHTLKLYSFGFGGSFDYRLTLGETTFESIQAVIHR